MKSSVALLAGALPALFSHSHEISPRRSSVAAEHELASSAAAAARVGWTVPPTQFGATRYARALRASSSTSRRCSSTGASGGTRTSSACIVSRHPRMQPARCRPKRRRAVVEAVRFGSSSLAGVEGPAWASEQLGSTAGASNAAGLDREPASRTVGIEGGGEEGLECAVAAEAAATVVVDKGELVCRRLEGVVSSVELPAAEQPIVLRVAELDDYFAIADVRFDVFSPVHSTLKHRFRERSCLLMRERRRRGAFCLVAALEGPAREAAAAAAAATAAAGAAAAVTAAERDAARRGKKDSAASDGGERGRAGGGVAADKGATVEVEVSDDHVLGTLECSRHEFDGTPLAVDVEEGGGKVSRLYLTEVAVRSDCRRMGVGRVLLGLVDNVARELQTSEVFLHVNEVNEAALRLYAKCGYEEAPDTPSNRAFTNSLGLSGGFIGQRHRLLHKTFQANDKDDGSGGAVGGGSDGPAASFTAASAPARS